MACCVASPITKRNFFCDHESNKYLQTLVIPKDTYLGMFGAIDFVTNYEGTKLKCPDSMPSKSIYLLPTGFTYGKLNGNLWRGTQKSEDHGCFLMIDRESGLAILFDTNAQESQRKLVRDRLTKRLRNLLGFKWHMTEILVPTFEHGCALAAATLIRMKLEGKDLGIFDANNMTRAAMGKRYKELMCTKTLTIKANQ